MAPMFGAGLGIVVYFGWNWLVFGTAVPVSGLVKQHWSRLWWAQEGGFDAVRSVGMTSLISQFHGELLVAWSIVIGFALMWHWSRKSSSHASRLLLIFTAGLFGLAVGHLAKFAQTVLTIHPSWASYDWYFVPAYLMMAMLVPTSVFVGAHIVRHFLVRRSQQIASLSTIAITLLFATILFARVETVGPFRYVAELRDTDAHDSWVLASYAGVRTVNRVLPDQSVIGSWHAGAVGYFARFPVVNLDGLANSYDYYRWMVPSGTRRPISPTVMGGLGLTHLADVWDFTPTTDRDFVFAGHSIWNDGVTRRFIIADPLFRESEFSQQFDESAQVTELWSKLIEAADYRAGDFVVFQDGSLVQVFARDCDADTWKQGTFSFSWDDAGDGGTQTADFVWSAPDPYRRGACTTPFVLPKAAIGSDVRVSVSAPSLSDDMRAPAPGSSS